MTLKNQVFSVVYMSVWCSFYAARQTMCKFISQHYFLAFYP